MFDGVLRVFTVKIEGKNFQRGVRDSTRMAAEELDRKAKMVLEAIYELGGEADTSAVKEYTGIESNGVVHYRYEKLEDFDLVDTDVEDRGGTLDVTVATLTNEGRRKVGEILEENEGPTLVEQMKELQQIVSDLNRRVQSFEGRIEAVEKEVDGVGEVIEQQPALERRLTEVEESVELMHDEMERKIEEGEQRIESKVSEAESVVERVERRDAINGDVRNILQRHGFLKPTREELYAGDLPESASEKEKKSLEKRRSNATRNSPVRDGYEAGDVIEWVASQYPDGGI